MENVMTHRRRRSLIRKEMRIAPVVVHSAARRFVDRLTRVYRKAFVSPEMTQVDLHKEEGYAWFQKGEYIKARDAFFFYLDEVEELEPGVLYMLAMCYKNMDENKEAVEFLRKADWIARNDPDIINELGECLFNIEEYPEAITFLSKAAKMTPGDAGVYYRLGVCHEKLGKTAEAEKFYRKAVALDPNQIEYHETLGLLYQAKERHKDALACLRDALHAEWRQKRGGGVILFLKKLIEPMVTPENPA
ncbi:MAG: tetratricopeptide repeat protein [Candidatus Omnitrophica bacterium]|nr:tetratricopeptide repeat protein [Candidatus Omnitrophota bacterium]